MSLRIVQKKKLENIQKNYIAWIVHYIWFIYIKFTIELVVLKLVFFKSVLVVLKHINIGQRHLTAKIVKF